MLAAAVVVVVALWAGGCGGGGRTSLASPGEETGRSGATQSWESVWVTVKYRSTPVDVGAPWFEALGRDDSSLVYAAWYDEGNDYLVINLKGTNYHYCGLPRTEWIALQEAASMGRHYNSAIKGRYDCRDNPVPEYG